MINHTQSLLTIISIIFFSSCSFQPTSQPPKYDFKYDLSAPSKHYELPKYLKEISGLSTRTDKKIICLQDEEGLVFQYNTEKKEVTKEFKFGKKNDYEGIEFVREIIYALRNDGTIYEIKNFDSKKQKTKKYTTFLDADYDTEGLGYDAKNHQLLIACKEKAGDRKDWLLKKAIYGFDLKTKKLLEKPVHLIDLEEIHQVLNNSDFQVYATQILSFLGGKAGNHFFKPAGIAVHPKTSDLYIVSTVGKILVVLSPSSKVLYAEPLNPKLFRQPEGITFLSDGTLLISNEGAGKRANILKFKML